MIYFWSGENIKLLIDHWKVIFSTLSNILIAIVGRAITKEKSNREKKLKAITFAIAKLEEWKLKIFIIDHWKWFSWI